MGDPLEGFKGLFQGKGTGETTPEANTSGLEPVIAPLQEKVQAEAGAVLEPVIGNMKPLPESEGSGLSPVIGPMEKAMGEDGAE